MNATKNVIYPDVSGSINSSGSAETPTSANENLNLGENSSCESVFFCMLENVHKPPLLIFKTLKVILLLEHRPERQFFLHFTALKYQSQNQNQLNTKAELV